MDDTTRQDVARIDKLLTALAVVLLLWAVVLFSSIQPWGFAPPPPEACRPAGMRATPATMHLPACPHPERRPAKQEPSA